MVPMPVDRARNVEERGAAEPGERGSLPLPGSLSDYQPMA